MDTYKDEMVPAPKPPVPSTEDIDNSIALTQDPSRTNKYLFPPRTSSLNAPTFGASPHEQEATVDKAKASRLSMLKKAKQKLTGLFSPSTSATSPSRNPGDRHSTTPNQSSPPPSSSEQEQTTLTPVPGRTNKFWLSPPTKRSRERTERKMLRSMSPLARERRSVTAESARSMGELKVGGVDVRDFQVERDEAEEAKEKDASEPAAAEEVEKKN